MCSIPIQPCNGDVIITWMTAQIPSASHAVTRDVRRPHLSPD